MSGGRVVVIEASRIRDVASFHDVFAAALGFPAFYGRNMNAWTDCLIYADEDDGMRSFSVEPGSFLTLRVDGYAGFKARCPELAEALVECAAFVNWARMEQGEAPVLALAFDS